MELLTTCTTDLSDIADYDLMCPILLDWLEDPIIMPCCGKAVSKIPLHECIKDIFNTERKCPNCSKSIKDFDILNAPVSLNILNIVKRFKESNPLYLTNKKPNKNICMDWEGKVDWLEPIESAHQTVIGKLKLNCLDPKFNFKTLLIPVIDKSGSMGGNPISQCIYSLGRIVDLAYSNPNIITNIITYNDTASSIFINTSQTIESYRNQIDSIKAGGGTSFTVAFNEIVKVAQQLIDPTVTNITVIFLTDGEDSSTNRTNRGKLVDLLKEKLNLISNSTTNTNNDNQIPNQISTQIHTIGFGASHDYDFLNSLRMISKIEGAYRYADPKEDTDSLSNKINSLLDVIAQTSNIPIKITNCPYPIFYSDNPVYWLNLSNCIGKSIDYFDIEIKIGLSETKLNVRCKFNEGENLQVIWNEWYTHLVDQLMDEVIGLVKQSGLEQNKNNTNSNKLSTQIHLELIEQRTKSLISRIKSNLTELEQTESVDLMRCEKILQTIKLTGSNTQDKTQLQKLNDMKFEGKFKTNKTNQTTNPNSNQNSTPGYKAGGTDLLVHKMEFKVKKNNWVCVPKQKLLKCDKEIIDNLLKKTTDTIGWFDLNEDRLLGYNDLDGLSFFHIACSIGKHGLISWILEKNKSNVNFVSQYSNSLNSYGKTPLDLAIQNGYWKTCKILWEYKFDCGMTNKENLLRTCVTRGFWKTGEFMVCNNLVNITDDLMDSVPTQEGLVWLTKMNGLDSIDVFKAIKKAMVDVVSDSIDQITNPITWSDYMDMFVKPTPDQVKIIDLLLGSGKASIYEEINVIEAGEEDKTTLLYMCCERGNLELFYTIIKHIEPHKIIEQINWQNLKGTSCLWIASCNKHVDIVTELLGMGADPNIVNIRGDSPIIPTCQKGSEAIIQLLLAYGIDLEKFNPDRENAIMVCCRNGQAKLLDIILNYIKSNLGTDKLNYYLEWCAKIDGFNPILSSVELGHIDCLKVVHSYGANLEFRTSLSNQIIQGATPLHLASFYGRTQAAKELISLGADIFALTETDKSNCLHLAIKHGHKDLVKFIMGSIDKKIVSELLKTEDFEGRTPEYYVHLAGNEELKEEFFTSKLSNIFSNLFITSQSDEIECADTIVKYGESPGVFEFTNLTELNLSQGISPLGWAILTGKTYLANKLIHVGSDIFKPDDRGISPYFWANYLGLTGKLDLLTRIDISENKLSQVHTTTLIQLNRIEQMVKSNPQYKMLLSYTPGMISPLSIEQSNSLSNHLVKMLNGFDLNILSEQIKLIEKPSPNMNLIGFIEKLKTNKITLNNTDLNSSSISQSQSQSQSQSEYWKWLLLDAKINVIKIIANGSTETNLINPNHILAIYLYTANLKLFEGVNYNLKSLSISSPWFGFIGCLFQGLKLLPCYIGECYRAIDSRFDNQIYGLENTIEWNCFSVSNYDWKNSSELIKLKRGMVFIIKSKTGKNISKYSKYPQENEIVFLPGTKFKVTNYYVPDIICLAQENIRNTTFKYNSIDKVRGFFDKAIEGKSSIIIELVEI